MPLTMNDQMKQLVSKHEAAVAHLKWRNENNSPEPDEVKSNKQAISIYEAFIINLKKVIR